MTRQHLSFAQARDVAVEAARAALFLDVDAIEAAIVQGEEALAEGVIDPVLYGASAPDLRQQLRFMRAFRNFRLALDEFVEVGS